MKVTVDTNAFPIDDLRNALEPKRFEFVSISVSKRELANTSLEYSLAGLRREPETAVWDEPTWDECTWADDRDQHLLEKALEIIGDGSFPKLRQRATLSSGQRRQLRDAIIACTHVRREHDVLLTKDLRGFVDGGRRERFRDEMGIRIMTPDEFRKEFIQREAPG